MLVIERRKWESVMIGNDITVTICEIRGGTISIGIEAPKDVPVHRQEVRERIYGTPEREIGGEG